MNKGGFFMGLFGIYMVKTRRGIRFMTAKKLCEKVIVESKQSNYNWSFLLKNLYIIVIKLDFQRIMQSK